MNKFFLTLLCVFGFACPAFAGENAMYKDGDTVLEGYIARPADTAKPAPVVMIVHQWMGLTDYEKMRADMLAKEGFVAFAVDMYGQGIRPKNIEEAGKLATTYKSDAALARKRINAALTYARTLPGTTGKIAVIGYCFGGTMALELARSGADINGVVSFHGGLSTGAPAQKGAIKAPVQVHHGADDPLVPPADVAAFKKEMEGAGARLEFHAYPGAVHAFTQKNASQAGIPGVAYNKDADETSWSRSLEFLKKALAS